MPGNKKVKIGVLGAGCWSYYAHFPAVKKHADAELVAVCQRSRDKLDAALSHWDVPHGFTDYKEMIDSGLLDALIVSTPHHFHYEPVKYALERDLHVLVEKPMVLKTEHARELIALARQKKRHLLVGFPLPCIPQARQVRELIVSGALGEVKFVSAVFASVSAILYQKGPLPDDIEDYLEEYAAYPYNTDTYNSPEVGGGQGQVMVSHAAGFIFWLTNQSAVQVYAMMNNDGYPVDVYDSYAFKLTNGALGVLASWATVSYKQKNLHEHRIQTEKATVIINLVQGLISIRWADGKKEDLPAIPPEGRWPQYGPAWNLVDVITGKADPICPGKLGLHTVEFVEAAYKSAASNQPTLIKE